MTLVLLLACSGAPVDDDETGTAPDDTAGDPSAAALVGLVASAEPDPDTVERGLSAVGRTGAIDVTHTGLVAACDVTWTAELAFEAPDTFAVSYARTDSADAPNGCAWTLDYAIVPVPEGTWTVSAIGEETQVPVPG
jgi:hypothetical protein